MCMAFEAIPCDLRLSQRYVVCWTDHYLSQTIVAVDMIIWIYTRKKVGRPNLLLRTATVEEAVLNLRR